MLTAAHVGPLWPQDTPDDALRRELAALLSEDPEHRLRVAHIEPLLQLRLGSGWGPARLRAALADAGCASFFSVDWGGKCEWQERVVHLNIGELMAALAAAQVGGAPALVAAAAPAAVVPAAEGAAAPAETIPPQLTVPLGYAAAVASTATPGGDARDASGDAGAAAGVRRLALMPDQGARLAAMIRATWPNCETDDDEYLASSIAFVLAFKRDAKGQLPRFTLHLTDVGGHLRAFTAVDARLESVFPRGSAGAKRGGARPKLSEFVAAPRLKPIFRIKESPARKSEKTVTLAVDKLARPTAVPAGTHALLPAFLLSGVGSGEPLTPQAASPAVASAPAAQEPLPPFELQDWPTVAAASGTADAGAPEPHELPAAQAAADAVAAPAAEPAAPVAVAAAAAAPRISDGGSSSAASCNGNYGHMHALFATARSGGLMDAPGMPSSPLAPRAYSGPDYSPLTSGFGGIGGLAPELLTRGGSGMSAASAAASARPLALDALFSGGPAGGGGGSVSLFSEGGQPLSSSVPRGIASCWGTPLGGLMGMGALSAADDCTPKSVAGEAGATSAPAGQSGGANVCGATAPAGSAADEAGGCGAASDSGLGDLDLDFGVASGCTDAAAPGADAQAASSYGSDWSSSFFAHPNFHDAPLAPAPATLRTPGNGAATRGAGRLVASDGGDGSSGGGVATPGSALAPTTPASAAEPPRGGAAAPKLMGWATVAAKGPTQAPTPRASAGSKDAAVGAPGARTNGVTPARKHSDGAATPVTPNGHHGGASTPALGRLPPRVRAEVEALVESLQGVLKLEDFDEGVVHQLNAKGAEEGAIAAVRHVAHYDLAHIQHMAAYINHIIKHHGPSAGSANGGGGGGAGGGGGGGASGGAGGAGTGASVGVYGGQIRLASVPLPSKAMLQRLPLRVYRRLEAVVGASDHLDWKHFDAGVVKVLAQLSKMAEDDVFEELGQLTTTDLSQVEYMPAFLNKRLNNRLWARRKEAGAV